MSQGAILSQPIALRQRRSLQATAGYFVAGQGQLCKSLHEGRLAVGEMGVSMSTSRQHSRKLALRAKTKHRIIITASSFRILNNPSFFIFQGSTDFGNVSFVVPGIHPYFYIGTDALNHTEQYTEAAGKRELWVFTGLSLFLLGAAVL